MTLGMAVAEAYVWDSDISEDETLGELLEMNLAGSEHGKTRK